VKEDLLDVVAEASASEEGGLCGAVIDELAGLCAELYDLALVNDEHALAISNCDDRAAGDDVIVTVTGQTRLALLASYGQNVIRQRITVKVLFPLL
jgi:hypothetical protein